MKHLSICDTPTQTGCVVQWNAVLPSATLEAIGSGIEQTFVRNYAGRPAKTTLCVNPLTFNRSVLATDATARLGAVPGDGGAGPLQTLLANTLARTVAYLRMHSGQAESDARRNSSPT